jgi:hypothetical protein
MRGLRVFMSTRISPVQKEVKANERFDVPVGAPHSAVVGPQGWIVIVGEEIEGDS